MDIVSIRIIVTGLVTGLLLILASVAIIASAGHETPPALTALGGTMAGFLAGLLMPQPRVLP